MIFDEWKLGKLPSVPSFPFPFERWHPKELSLQSHFFSPRESLPEELSLRFFLRARFRAKACFTRRFSPGFR